MKYFLYRLTKTFVVIAASFAFASKVFAQPRCEDLFRSVANLTPSERFEQKMQIHNAKMSEAQGAWTPQNFSDPKRHDGKNFIYIVHAIRDPGQLHSSRDHIELPDFNKHYVLSASVISESHTNTIRPYGFILEVPATDIASANQKDVHVDNNYFYGNSDQIKRRLYLNNEGLPTPRELVNRTPPEAYNEINIFLQGFLRSNNYADVDRPTITGVFFKVSQVPDGEKAIFKAFAAEIGVPTVELP